MPGKASSCTQIKEEPARFFLTCLYLLFSSLAYALSDANKRWGAYVGLGVLLFGVLILLASPFIDGVLHSNRTRRKENDVPVS